MTFRRRIFLALTAAALLPLALLAYGVRREMSGRLAGEYERRLTALATGVHEDLAADADRSRRAVTTLARDLAADNRFRLAAVQRDAEERGWLLDYAGTRMRAAGLALLQIQDDDGRILSSGHFRNDFDRVVPELPRLVAASDAITLVRARTARGAFLSIAQAASLDIGGRRFTVLGGVALDSAAFLRVARDPDLAMTLVAGPDTLARAGARDARTAISELAIGYVDATAAPAPLGARIVISRRPTALDAIRRGIDRWTLAALAITLLLALAVAASLATGVSRPLARLTEQTAALDLERLDQDFATDRDDEIGTLSRMLGALTDRLRTGTARLREAERRAAFADVARQVNHDVKNGLAPIRHVLRHLSDVARDEPGELPAVFAERRGTLESSVAYLETLARNYARIAPASEPAGCDVNALVREIAAGIDPAAAQVRLALAPVLPELRVDPVALRRIVENLAGNAVESLVAPAGTVTIATSAADGVVRVAVGDTGRGMTRDELARAFDDFHTTKATGTGLGLSVVRRLVSDLGGTLRVETESGRGSCFTVELPAGGVA